MFNFTKETLDGITYFTTVNARGTSTMIFKMNDEIFVQVNRSPAKALCDIKKPSQDVKNLLTVM